MADIARLTQLIETEATALGFELVRVRLSGQGEERTLQVMAEDPATGQLVMGQCAQLSRAISASIDAVEEAEGELVEGAYMLEVGSPGIDRPLTRPKDYAQWIGHDAKIAMVDGYTEFRRLSGPLLAFEDGQVSIEDRKAGPVTVPLSAINYAQLVLTDKLIAATQPLDMSGADEFDETPAEEVQD
ncbi:ribosome maturation factor [Altererythrobacter sp. KTW20L]|uniref:ribosome maturation factor n=1 Tax=Altererythrobacter sp. KTW20L TaxID=2942210 RepID=UPI0020BFB1ED|nr:ribosome maturation factor [Altererythrobacter sp. KTW20L]